MLLYGGIALIIGFVVGIYSLAREKVFLVLMFVGLPIAAFLSKYAGDFGPNMSMNTNKNVNENVMDAFLKIPEEYRIAALVFLPALIAGRIAVTIYRANQDEKFMDPAELSKKKKQILKSYGMSK